MRRRTSQYTRVFLPLLYISILAACNNSAPVLRFVSVAPTNATISVAATQQFTATVFYSDGSQKDGTTLVSWNSSSPGIATIDSVGLATGVASGATTITASIAGVSGSATLTVQQNLTSISVTCAPASISLPLTSACTATGNPGNVDLTNQVTWNSSNTGVATIASTGVAQSTGAGSTNISATFSTLPPSNNFLLTVTAVPVADGLTLAPANPTAAVGNTVAFAATEHFNDGTSGHSLTGAVTWAVSNCSPAGAASIGADNGIALALKVGSCKVTGTEVPSSLTGSTTLTVVAAVARFAYVANVNDFSISAYVANPATGTLTPIGKVSAIQPQQAIVHPSGKFVYSINGDSTVSVYTANATDGVLTNTGLAPKVVGISGTNKGAIDATGRVLYVVYDGTDSVYGFTIDQNSGALTPILGSPFATGSIPVDVLIAPSGLFAYVVNYGADSITGYSIDPITGALTALVPATATGGSPLYSAVDPSGTYLYVPNNSDSTVSVFQIAGDGSLSEITGSPFAVAGSTLVYSVAVDPTGTNLYVLDSPSSNGSVYGYAIVAGGAVGSALAGSPYPVGAGPVGLAIDPAGAMLEVANNFDNTLSLFTIASTGVLTPVNPTEAGSAPQFPVFADGTSGAAVTPAAVVAANTVPGTLSAFSTDSSGVLTAVGTPFTSIPGNAFIATNGWNMFTSSASAKEIAGYGVFLTATPPFVQLAAPNTVLGAAGNIAADTSHQYVYVADTTNKTIAGYDASTLASLGVPGLPLSVPDGVAGLTSDPQFTLIYAFGTGFITPVLTQTASGGLAGGTPVAAAGTWTAGAVGPAGTFLAAVDSTANKLQVFSIIPVSGSGPGTDGQLTAVGTAVSIPAGVGPYSVAYDPLGRIVVVSDFGANKVTPFTVASDGTLTAGTALTTPTGAGQAAFDATGAWLFVGVYGDPLATPAVAGGVQVYSVAANGTLTAVGTPVSAGNGTWGVGVLTLVQ